MEALSPRDANVQLRKQIVTKSKPAPAKLASKEKDHPLPPPPEVFEPPCSQKGYKNGAVYQTGKLLGKGGFAICYEGRTTGKQVVALKIVKSKMALEKMKQKVGLSICFLVVKANLSSSFKPSFKSIPKWTISISSVSTEHSPSRKPPTLYLSFVLTVP